MATNNPTPPPDVIRLLTVREAINRLSIGRSKFYLEVQAGNLPLRKVGGSSRVRSDELDAYISNLPAYGESDDEAGQ